MRRCDAAVGSPRSQATLRSLGLRLTRSIQATEQGQPGAQRATIAPKTAPLTNAPTPMAPKATLRKISAQPAERSASDLTWLTVA